jgi:hypothetical protein
MKRLIIHIALMIVYSAAAAGQWKGFALWNPKEGTDSSSFAVIYDGKNFDPPMKISEMSESIDRTSPTNLLKTLYWACNHLDPSAYNKLFAPGELKQAFVADSNSKTSEMELERIIEYGDYSILKIHLTVAVTNYSMLWPVKRIGNQYYATDDLVGSDNAYDFLNYYYAWELAIGKPIERELQNVTLANNEFVYFTNFVHDDTHSPPPIVFRFQGKRFGTNDIIDRWPVRQDEDLTSPAGTLAAAIASLNSGDVDRYSDLLEPEERTNILTSGTALAVGQTWDTWMRSQFKREAMQKRPAAIRLDEEITYIDKTVVLIYEDADSKPGTRRDIMYFRKHGSDYYISHKIEETANLLPDYLGFSKYMGTKMFPHFNPISQH